MAAHPRPVASVSASGPESSVAGYHSAKAAPVGLSEALSMELGPKGSRVNALAPGRSAPLFGFDPGSAAAEPDEVAGTDRDGAMGTAATSWGGLALDGYVAEPVKVAELVVLLASGRPEDISGFPCVTGP